MNILSDDEILIILKFLPAEDRTIFKRLSRQFASIIDSNSKIFPRPEVRVHLEPSNTSVNFWPVLVVIYTRDGSISFEVNEKRKIIFDDKNRRGPNFVLPFLLKANPTDFIIPHNQEKYDFDTFAQYLFPKFFISCLDLNTGNYDFAGYFVNTLLKSDCRCYKVHFNGNFNGIMVTGQDFFTKLSKHQKELGVSTKLFIEDPKIFELDYTDIKLMILLCQYYDDISIFYNPCMFLTVVFCIARYWHSGNFSTGNVHLRLHYRPGKKYQDIYKSSIFKIMEKLNLEIINVTTEELDAVLSSPTLEGLQPNWDFKQLLEPGVILRMCFEKLEKELILTSSFIPVEDSAKK